MKSVKSPFELQTDKIEPKKFFESSSVPPGAHEDQFRRVRYDTTKSRNDPERTFYTTTSMTEGVRTTPQPPWYYGYQNSLKPQDSDPVLCSARYGFRGARDIGQFLTNRNGRPEMTATEYTPQFLNTNAIDDEWGPPIQNEPLVNGYALTSPGLWPENAEYPTGFVDNNEIPTSPLYKRETTLGHAHSRPYTSPDTMVKTMGRRTDPHIKELRKSAHLESRQQLESLQRSATINFQHTWNEKLNKTANATLRATMKKETPPYVAHTLSDPADHLRYADSTAIITNSTSAEELVFKQYMEKCKAVKPYDMKWNQVIANFRIIKTRLLRDQSTKDAIDIMAKNLQREAYMHGQKDALMRVHFIAAMGKTSYFEHLPMKQMSLLFSMFDPKKKSIIQYADLICAFKIFDNPRHFSENIIELIKELWRVYEKHGNNDPPIEYAEKVLTTCCGSREEERFVNKLFKEKFRPVLYRLSLRNEEDFSLKKARSEQALPCLSAESSDRSDPDGLKSPVKGANRKDFKGSTVKPAFNIYNHCFDENMLIAVLNECPQVLEAFKEQYDARMVQCYGKEKDASEEVPQMEEKDFSWILARKK